MISIVNSTWGTSYRNIGIWVDSRAIFHNPRDIKLDRRLGIEVHLRSFHTVFYNQWVCSYVFQFQIRVECLVPYVLSAALLLFMGHLKLFEQRARCLYYLEMYKALPKNMFSYSGFQFVQEGKGSIIWLTCWSQGGGRNFSMKGWPCSQQLSRRAHLIRWIRIQRSSQNFWQDMDPTFPLAHPLLL